MLFPSLQAHTPQVHKNIPSVNAKLKVVKHLIRFVVCYFSSLNKLVTQFNSKSIFLCYRIQPLKLPQGLPAEEDMSNTCLKSTGELVVKWHLSPVEQEAVKS